MYVSVMYACVHVCVNALVMIASTVLFESMRQ